jgi:hypothetical protein
MRGIFDRALRARNKLEQQKERLFKQLDHTTVKILQEADENPSLLP